MTAAKWNRKLHRWGALLTCLPLAIIFGSGVFLQLKKDWAWVQPPTMSGAAANELSISFDQVLASARGVPEAQIESWADVERLDVRPDKGMLKVRSKHDRWEVQVDASTGEVLSSTTRRSDLIETIHDGSWFHPRAKLWIWLPTAFILCSMWCTGVYLWLLPHLVRRRRKVKGTL